MAPNLFGSAHTSSGIASLPVLTSQQQFGATNTHDPRDLSSVLQEVTTLSTAVAGPELFGDDRDAIIALLNKLLASAGVGSGYFRPNQPPCNFTANNIFHRLKGIGYNRLSKHKNQDGLVSLILEVPRHELESVQQKQKALDVINSILQPKTTAGLLGQQQKQSGSIRTEVKSITSFGERLTELVIIAKEHVGTKRGVLSATELYNELMHQDRITQLRQNLNCCKVVPHIELDKTELERYLRNPLPGFEELWIQAIKENPDIENLVPYPIQGFQQLVQRKAIQNSVVFAQSNALNGYISRLSQYEGEILSSHNKYVKSIQVQKNLSHRLIRFLSTQILIQRYGMIIDEKEENLQSKIESINAQINGPNKLKEEVTGVYEILKSEGNVLRSAIQDKQDSSSLKAVDMKELSRCLATRHALLENLVSSIKLSMEALRIVEQNI